MCVPFVGELQGGLPPQVDFKSRSMNAELTIGAVARDTGVPASTLRYWESAGLLAPPGRAGGKRRYDPDTLRQVSLIVLIKRAGLLLAFSIASVSTDGLAEMTAQDTQMAYPLSILS